MSPLVKFFLPLQKFITSTLVVPALVVLVAILVIMAPAWFIQVTVALGCLGIGLTLAIKAITRPKESGDEPDPPAPEA